jgi:hypothetical protein
VSFAPVIEVAKKGAPFSTASMEAWQLPYVFFENFENLGKPPR